MQSAILVFFFFSSFSFASCSSVSEMILFSWRTESCLRFPQSCHSLRWLEFQCYKNGDGHCSDSFSGLTSVRVFLSLAVVTL